MSGNEPLDTAKPARTSGSHHHAPTENAWIPDLKVVLKPYGKDGTVRYIDVAYEIECPALARVDLLAQIHLNTASIPVCVFGEGGLGARDRDGELPLRVLEGPGEWGEARKWFVERPTAGDVRMSYRVFPRILPENYRSSPYFDLRTEDGGANGAGVTFMVMPPEREYRIHLHWDLTHMPYGSRGVWCMGEGDVTLVDRPSLLAFSYYAVGDIKEYKETDDDTFAMYWLSEPSFDTNAVARRIKDLFDCMSSFFEDKGAPYKVFVRKDPFEKSGGGTALRDSFMFGWSDATKPTPDSLQNLLAHEMVHNWPHLDGKDGEVNWYNEGAAEYYSVVLPYRAGLSTLDDVLAQLATRTERYYGNPLRDMSLAEAHKICWSDRNAQRLPYGRGFFYLVDIDAQIREASKGARSLDDVVLEMLRRKRRGEPYGIEAFLELVERETGTDARAGYLAMVGGKMIEPKDNWFGGAFRAVKETLPDLNGNDIDSYRWEIRPGVSRESIRL